MKKIFLLISILIGSGFPLAVYTADNEEVYFLEKEPPMDGVLYKNLLEIPQRNFNSIQGNASSTPSATYRLAYGMCFLYVMIEVGSDSISFRDRAYQNGDGLIITIAKPKPNSEPADEFYVLGFSPGDELRNIKPSQFIWYKGFSLKFQPLKDSKICSTIQNNKVYLQVLVYWHDVYPFHPAFEETIGFNLCFVKAIGGSEKTYLFDVYDEQMQSEESERRYEVLKFANAEKPETPQVYCMLSRNNLTNKDNLDLITFCCGKPKSVVDLKVEIKGIDFLFYQTFDYSLYNDKGSTKIFFDLPVNNMPPKNYNLIWHSGESQGTIKFTILPEISYDKLYEELIGYRDKLSRGSFNTLMFKLQNIKTDLEVVKQYEACPELEKNLSELFKLFKSAKGKNDTLYNMRGLFRRAFLSEIDSAYRPYTLRVPDDFNRHGIYPLLVYLHGSGDDDRAAFMMNPLTAGNFIELYPNGRGTSNVYCTPESQKDIWEAINDVILNYPIDTTNIILSGFSMGGYGAYKTFYEQPSKFKALAVFSGHPDLASEWLGEGYPDFLEDFYMKNFKSRRLFIFHGTEDLNCPFGLTESFVNKLNRKGAKVEFVTEVTGHTSMSPASHDIFLAWLEKMLYYPKYVAEDEIDILVEPD